MNPATHSRVVVAVLAGILLGGGSWAAAEDPSSASDDHPNGLSAEVVASWTAAAAYALLSPDALREGDLVLAAPDHHYTTEYVHHTRVYLGNAGVDGDLTLNVNEIGVQGGGFVEDTALPLGAKSVRLRSLTGDRAPADQTGHDQGMSIRLGPLEAVELDVSILESDGHSGHAYRRWVVVELGGKRLRAEGRITHAIRHPVR